MKVELKPLEESEMSEIIKEPLVAIVNQVKDENFKNKEQFFNNFVELIYDLYSYQIELDIEYIDSEGEFDDPIVSLTCAQKNCPFALNFA